MVVGGGVLGLCVSLLKRTHTILSFRTPLPRPLPPPFILSLTYPRRGPLGHPSSPLSRPRSAAVACVYSARARGPSEGTMASFRETVDPTAEQGSLHGGQPTPVPQTSQPPATELHTHTHISPRHAHTNNTALLLYHYFSLAPFPFVSHFPQTPSRWPWLFGGCSRDPVTPVQDPHAVSHFPARLCYFSTEK